jgi:glucose/mannose transport system substrate-binding protein
MREQNTCGRLSMLVVAASVAGFALVRTAAAEPLTAEVVNVWTGGGEVAAKQVLADRYNAAGGKFVDTAAPCSTCLFSVTITRILAGNPSTAAQFPPSTAYVDLINKGMLGDIDHAAAAGEWRNVLPKVVLDAVTSKGKFYLVPIDTTAANWIFYNQEVLKKAGVEPPTNFDASFFSALDKIKAAGFIPLALGGSGLQYRWAFEAIMAGLGGREQWEAVWLRHDEKALQSPLQRSVFETFKRLHDYIDSGSSGRAWNPTTNLLISGQAGIQVIGDWAKGEFKAAGKLPGKDFGCVLPGNPPMYVMNGDLFGFPKQTKPDEIKAQELFAQVVMNPVTQVEFTLKKGGLPSRTDIDITKDSRFDECSQKASAVYKGGGGVVGNSQLFLTPDSSGALLDLLSEYFNTPAMSTDEAIGRFASIVKNN